VLKHLNAKVAREFGLAVDSIALSGIGVRPTERGYLGFEVRTACQAGARMVFTEKTFPAK